MDYLEYFQLETEPFSNAPVSRFYFDNEVHSRALIRLKHAAETMKGLALLVGEIGTGKTTLARKMLDELPEEKYEAALLVIIHASISSDWLLRRIAQQLGVSEPKPDKLELLRQVYQRLVEIHESGRKAVVMVDEAQMLQTKEIMEEFRGMLNLEIPGKKLITFIFFGLPEMEQVLKLDPPLEQRVGMKYQLSTFDFDATAKYISHRLKLAGAQSALFEDGAIEAIYKYSRGIPRMINTICDNCLFEGYITKAKAIHADHVHGIAVDLGLRTPAEIDRQAQQRREVQADDDEDEIQEVLDGMEVE